MIQGDRLMNFSVEGVGVSMEKEKGFFISRDFLTDKFWTKLFSKEKFALFGDNFKNIFAIWELENKRGADKFFWQKEEIFLMLF